MECSSRSLWPIYMPNPYVFTHIYIQHLVEEKERGVVGGFQRTLESLFELSSFLLVLLMPQPSEFPILAGISYLMTLSAATVFSIFSCKEAKRRAHPEQQPIWPNHPADTTPWAPIGDNPLLFERLSTVWSVVSDNSEVERGNSVTS